MELLDAIEKRRSIRKFKSKRVAWPDILEAIDASTKTPLAGNISTIKFIIVSDPKLKIHLADYSDQPWLAGAEHLLIVCSEDGQLEKMYDDRAAKYARQQAGAAIQNLLLRLTELGIGSCWVGSFLDHEIKNLLKIPSEVNIEAIIAIGHADEKPSAKRKPSLQNIISWDKWGVSKKPTAYAKEPKD